MKLINILPSCRPFMQMKDKIKIHHRYLTNDEFYLYYIEEDAEELHDTA